MMGTFVLSRARLLKLLGQEVAFVVLDIDESNGVFTASRKMALERLCAQTWPSLAVGAVASFQLEDLAWSKNTCRQKLKNCPGLGVVLRHKFTGIYSLNVYTPGKFPGLDRTLRLLALAQLYTRMFRLQPCSFVKANRPLSA
ncbi:MAG: hypothetical protein H5T99_05275, partial [Moorella sp. (in: Bacteria)]|nr:hypothetical protein [Moorella sp. (in: firmicutes)]